jgi:hypothetical protein
MHPMFRVNTSFSGWSFTDERYEFVKLKGLIYRLIIQTLYPGMHGMVLRARQSTHLKPVAVAAAPLPLGNGL